MIFSEHSLKLSKHVAVNGSFPNSKFHLKTYILSLGNNTASCLPWNDNSFYMARITDTKIGQKQYKKTTDHFLS